MSIFQKILEAQKAIKYVPKNGKNTFHKYDYAMEADILDTVKKAANDNGLILITSAESEIGTYNTEKMDYNGNKTTESIRWAKVTLIYEVIDAESGESIKGHFDGYAEDKGDKAIYKATTGANKYFLMKFFGVATGDDPEREEEEAHKPTKQGPQPVRNTRLEEARKMAQQIGALVSSGVINAEEVNTYGQIPSVKEARDKGDVESLQNALNLLKQYVIIKTQEAQAS